MKILGIHAALSSNQHDPSAALIIDGEIIAAIEEERLNRIKTSSGYFPSRAIREVLKIGSIKIEELDLVVFPGISYSGYLDKLKRIFYQEFRYVPKLVPVHHAMAHIAGAYYGSGFSNSLAVSIDGLGDGVSTMICDCSSNGILVLHTAGIEASLGEFYAAFTDYLGYHRAEDQYKVMGMAAYAEDYHDLSEIIEFKSDSGKIYINPKLFTLAPATSLNEPVVNFDYLEGLNIEGRAIGDKIFSKEHYKTARSIQNAYEKNLLALIKHYKGNHRNIVLSGGCALNCLANGLFLNEFESVYVMPAASDRGLSLGSAMLAYSEYGNLKNSNMFLGKQYSNDEILYVLQNSGLHYQEVDQYNSAAQDIAEGRIVGWFQGRSEFGPRALGARSILASSSLPGMKNLINKNIKYREEYRPFAPAVMKSFAERHGIINNFEYMTIAIPVPESLKPFISETVHLDGSARIQTVNEKNPYLFPLLRQLELNGETPAVINTSFNTNGEPIVENPKDALKTFVACGMDVLYLGKYCIRKNRL